MDRSALDAVYPVLDRALEARSGCLQPGRTDEQIRLELATVREELVELLSRVSHCQPDGHGESMRQALIYWLDEIFSAPPTPGRFWVNDTLEFLLLGSRERAARFWELVGERHKSAQLARLCKLCIQLGFVGEIGGNQHFEVSVWLRDRRPRAALPPAPGRELQPLPPCPVLRGRAWLRGVGWLAWLSLTAWLGIALYYLASHL